MFSTFQRLKERSGHKKPERFEYLKKLVEEYSAITTSLDMKRQLIANLANFAYDPINYEFLRELSVLNIFLDLLADDDYLLTRFAISGLCNLALDPENKQYILLSGGVAAVSRFLSSNDEETVLSAITTLMFLITPQSKTELTSSEIVQCMLTFSLSQNQRLANLAKLFLEDYCTVNQTEDVKNSVNYIPLPNT
ncbi:armadillo repeat-containing protein 7-like [Lycorma delicatula]|uniref:armadillo repeat-containing protein 7-like n=1 Tax=Lycorma delicatula TaxID=130591 RepID=UPI003F51151D